MALSTVLIIAAIGYAIYHFFLKPAPPPPVYLNPNAQVKEKIPDDPNKPTLKVLFGSQTGTAENFSKILVAEGRQCGFNMSYSSLEDIDHEDFFEEERNIIFVMATHGEGEPTDDAFEFYHWLVDQDHENDMLSKTKFTVFGLGNRQYEHYNFMGREINKLMAKFGAESVFEHGEGDDDGTLEDDFAEWKDEMWPALCSAFGASGGMTGRRFKMDTHSAGEVSNVAERFGKPAPVRNPDQKRPVWAKVVKNTDLYSADAGRVCRHVEFDIEGTGVSYEHGDHMAVFPENNADLVAAYAKRLNVDLDTVFSLLPEQDGGPDCGFPCPTTIRTALTCFRDLTTPPSQRLIKVLSEYTTNDEEKARLTLMGDSSAEGKTEHQKWVKNNYRTLLEVLEAFPSCKPNFDHILEVMPVLQPRWYSISSSPRVHKHRIHITMAVTEYTTPTGRKHNGIATTWLRDMEALKEGSFSPVCVRRSTFKLPRDVRRPVIMIGPGTGFAPFRGFLQERSAIKERDPIHPIGKAILFFGNRNSKQDYMYEDEIAQYLEKKAVDQVYTAFSREGTDKVYVQHRLEEHGKEVWEMLQKEQGYLYICGDAKHMAKDVLETLKRIIQKEWGRSEEAAQQFIDKLQKQGRYLADVWT